MLILSPENQAGPTSFLTTFTCAMARAVFGIALTGFSQLAIRADAGLGVNAPEQAIVRARHSRVRLGKNELPLPAQRRTEVRMIGVETIGFADHAGPPDAAFKMARFTATRASCTL